MVGGYQILDLTGYVFVLDPETGESQCHVEGSYNIAMRKNKPILVTGIKRTRGNVTREYPAQFVVFNKSSENDDMGGTIRIEGGETSPMEITPEDFVKF